MKILITVIVCTVFLATAAYAGITNPLKGALPTKGDAKEEAVSTITPAGELSQIIIYKGERPGIGTGIISLKMKVGDEVFVTAKGVDKNGKEVPITPTWTGDKEFSIKAVEGRPQTAVVKALKPGTPVFLSATHKISKDKKIQGEIMGEIK